MLAVVTLLVAILAAIRSPHWEAQRNIMGHCPQCGSNDLARDAASPWIFIGATIFFPFSLLFFLLNRNVWCRQCGIRFKK